MAAYNYKYVSSTLPDFAKEGIEDYEGTADYDGDLWFAAGNYLQELEKELAYQYSKTKKFQSGRLLDWLKTRPQDSYNNGPMIKE